MHSALLELHADSDRRLGICILSGRVARAMLCVTPRVEPHMSHLLDLLPAFLEAHLRRRGCRGQLQALQPQQPEGRDELVCRVLQSHSIQGLRNPHMPCRVRLSHL